MGADEITADVEAGQDWITIGMWQAQVHVAIAADINDFDLWAECRQDVVDQTGRRFFIFGEAGFCEKDDIVVKSNAMNEACGAIFV